MATNTSATSQNHNGTGSQANFAISFPFLLNSEIEVTVGGVPKTLGTHYNIVGSEVQFTSGNIPASGTANIVFNRDTNISTKRVDFEDGSVLTEADLDNNVNQVLFAQQELSNDYVKRDGTQTVTGNLVFEGSADDANETTLAITNPTADRTITVPDRTGTIITSGDTGTVTNTILAGNSVDSSKIIDGSIVNADVNASAAIAQSKLNIANATTSAAGYQSAADKTKLDGIEPNATQDQTSSDIKTLLASDPLTATHLAANSVDSSELVDGSVDHSHLSNDCVDGDNVQDDSIDSEHIAAGSLDNEHYAAGSITSDKLNGATVITASEQGSATTNDTSFLTSAAADARFFNISSGDTIKNGDTFPDNDTTIATTAAINDRIIDLIDDVGGFTIIASEQAFPDVNPQGVTGQAAVLSVKTATTNLVPSGTTVTITNGNVADNADITITGVPSTIPSGFGFLVESTTTLHEYAFHRLVPNATEVTTVAGKAVEIGRLGTAAAVEDMSILGTTDVVADMAILGTTDVVADMNTLATSDVVSDMNTLAVADVLSDMSTVADNVTNVNNVGNNITNVNNLTNSTGANQTFTVTVQNVSGNKYFIDGVQTPVLKLARGKTYTFNLADSSNSGHPLAFRDSSDNAYTTGVTTNGTAGSSGATVVIVVAANAPSSLKYYCTSHGNAMGNTINVIDDNVGAVAGALTNVNLVGGSITNVNNVGGSISNVNTVATNINNVNDFFDKYRVGSQNPTTSLDTGDLFFNTSTNSLKVYTGSAWVDGVTTTGNFALKTGNTFTGSNIHNDNVKSIFGTDSDFQIYHSGNNAFIFNNTGQFILRGDQLQLRSQTNSHEYYLKATNDAGVELYYDNGKKFETVSAGCKFAHNIEIQTSGTKGIIHTGYNIIDQRFDTSNYDTIQFKNAAGTVNYCRIGYQTAGGSPATSGILRLEGQGSDGEVVLLANGNSFNFNKDGHFTIGDNQFIKIGANQDLQIYHDGFNSYIRDQGTGKLKITTSYFGVLNPANNENMIEGIEDGAVNLYYNGIKKLETTGSGVTVTGGVVADGFTLGDNENIQFGASNDLKIFHNGSHSYIADIGTGDLRITGSGIMLQNAAQSANMFRAFEDLQVELYYDNSRKIETHSTGGNVLGSLGINTTSPASTIDARAASNATVTARNTGTVASISMSVGSSTNQLVSRGVNVSTARDLIFMVGSTTATRLDSNGHLRPETDSTFDLGSNAIRWRNFYADTLYGDGSNLTGINTDLVSDTSPQLGGNLVTDGNLILLGDSSGTTDDRIRFGSGTNDFWIYHNGTDSVIDNNTGDLIIDTRNDCDFKVQGALNVKTKGGDEFSGKFNNDSSVQLYFDNDESMATFASGINVYGTGTTGYIAMYNQSGVDGTLAGYVRGYHNGSSNSEIGFADENNNWVLRCDIGGSAYFWRHFNPASNNTYTLGSSSYRWSNIYTNDLNLSNEGSANDVDGTWGSYTIQEGEESLFLINKRNGKKYKFNLTEVS